MTTMMASLSLPSYRRGSNTKPLLSSLPLPLVACICLILSSAISCHANANNAASSHARHHKVKDHRHRHRRLDEGYFFEDAELAAEMAGSSIKFQSCTVEHREQEHGHDADEEESGTGGLFGFGKRRRGRRLDDGEGYDPEYGHEPAIRRYVTFRTCFNSGCDATCTYGYGEYTIDMLAYLDIIVEYKMELQDRYCDMCNECVEAEDADAANDDDGVVDEEVEEMLRMCNSIDTPSCYSECQNIENMEMNGYLDASEFIECQLLYEDEDTGEAFYSGAMCASSGTRIKIGIFTDEECSIVDETKELEDYLIDEDGYGMKLSYHLLKQTWAHWECVAECSVDAGGELQDENLFDNVTVNKEENGNGIVTATSVPEINEVCAELYFAAVQQEQYYDGDQDSSGFGLEEGYDHEADEWEYRTCMTRDSNGTLFAGEDCDVEATSVCNWNMGAMDDNGTLPFFCTHDGVCEPDASGIDGFCLCPPGFYGVHCEFADAEEEDEGDDYLDDSLDDLYFVDDDMAVDNLTEFIVDGASIEYNALAVFYSLALGQRWERNDLWLSTNVSVCEWYGVGCNEDGYISSLELSGNLIRGSSLIAYGLVNLVNLTTLDLSNNQMFGDLESEIDILQSLTHLKLGNNRLRGSITSSLSSLSRLETLELQGNQFTSLSVKSYSRLANLSKFDISSNWIMGTLPFQVFAENPKLRYLNISRNLFTGMIDADIMNAVFDDWQSERSSPIVLDLSFNRFEGTLPNLDLEFLDINVVGNMLEGIDPEACGREWNGGATVDFGCDGIACSVGTANDEGLQRSEGNPCVACSVASYVGNVGCQYDSYGGDDAFDEDLSMTDDYHDHDQDDYHHYDQDDNLFGNGPSPALSLSYLQVVSPPSLVMQGGYDHRVALFGPIAFFGAAMITANVYYADSDLCEIDFDIIDNDDGMDAFILMVDRGQCTFVTKVRNAQRLGALAVIFADNVCLCDAGDSCTSLPGKTCESRWPIMGDDGSGGDIRIPSFAMLKQDADVIKDELRASTDVAMEMTLTPFPRSDSVDYELWMTPMDAASRDFILSFKETAQALRGYAHFTPRFFILDGIEIGCTDGDGEEMCLTSCTNGGRYCAGDPDGDFNDGISGADIVQESLRWICIWEQEDSEAYDVGVKWFEYVSFFINECASGLFANSDCINNGLAEVHINPQVIAQCMNDSGGLEGNEMNELLEKQLNGKTEQHISVVPTFWVNGAAMSGEFNSATALEAICAGFVAAIAPPVCRPTPTNTFLAEYADPDGVPGYINLGPGSCQDARGEGYSNLQSTSTFSTIEVCEEKCNYRNLESYRGFEFSLTRLCTCFFDKDGLPSPAEPVTESPLFVSKIDEGVGAVTGTSGSPGSRCYKVIKDVIYIPSADSENEPLIAMPSNYTVSNFTASIPAPVPSSEPSSAPSSTTLPTREFVVSEWPTAFVNSNAGQNTVPHWLVILLLFPLAFSG